MKDRVNIGLLIHQIENDYGRAIIKGAYAAAEEQDVNLFIFPGRGFNEPYENMNYSEYDYQHNVLYEFVSEKNLDVLIVSAGTIGNYIANEQMLNFLHRYSGIPILTMEMKVGDYPCIRYDSSGIRDAVLHLVKDCKRKKIGFVCGPRGSQDAADRLAAFYAAMEECGMPATDKQVVYGNFSQYDMPFIRELLDKNEGDLDGICFANDNMCVSGYQVFRERGIRPGIDIAVTGYDDSEVALELSPKLTTVRADAAYLGYHAIRAAKKLSTGQSLIGYEIKSSLIVRESSGVDADAKADYSTIGEQSSEMIAAAIMKEILAWEASCNFYAYPPMIRFLAEILEYAKDFDAVREQTILTDLKIIMTECREVDFPKEKINPIMKRLKAYILSAIPKDEEKKDKIYHLFDQISSTMLDYISGNVLKQRTSLAENYRVIGNMYMGMTSKQKEAAVDDKLYSVVDNLSQANFESAYIFEYFQPFSHQRTEKFILPDKLYLKAYCNGKDKLEAFPGQGIEMNREDWVANEYLPNGRRVTMIVSPLFSNELQYGILLSEVDYENLSYVSSTSPQVSSIVKLTKLMEELETATKAKSDFLASMSHEIRTPINAILGLDEMILKESKEEEILEYASGIQTSGNALLSLINEILDMSKIESGKMELVPAVYDTAKMMDEIYQMIYPRAEQKGLKFSMKIAEDLPEKLYGDDLRIRQVITNLLTNAVKYTRKGKVTLYAEAKRTGDDSMLLSVRVKDTGIGVKEEEKAGLFESFQRLDMRRNRNVEGTGLGLSICVNFLRMMGSELQVESEYQKGSVFSFEVPQKIVDATPIGDFKKNVLKKTKHVFKEQVSFTAPDAKVLVVDDNSMNLFVAKQLLKETMIQVDTAESGAECLELLKQKEYHVVLMDHMMPEMDGIETLQKLREEGYSMPVIVLTANAVVGAKQEYLSLGFNNYLSKPIDSKRLFKLLQEYLPESMIRIRENEAKPAKKEKKKFGFRLLDENMGIRYCADSVENYIEMLRVYLGEAEGKYQKLCDSYQEKDDAAYLISVHTLKSTSRYIGAELLAKQAEGLESAARAENWTYIRQNHEKVLEMYRAVLKDIEQYFASKRKKETDAGSITKEEAERQLQEIKESISLLSIVSAVKKLETLGQKKCGEDSLQPFCDKVIALTKKYDIDSAVAEIDNYLRGNGKTVL